jgi:hypothetical protein
VITDRDHKRLAEALNQAGDFAELVYPTDSFAEAQDMPYVIFRVNGGDSR